MQVFKTSCNTDWKGRPNHTLELIATVKNEKAAQKTIATDEFVQNFEDDGNENFEMQDQGTCRQFVEKYEDGGITTTVFHLRD